MNIPIRADQAPHIPSFVETLNGSRNKLVRCEVSTLQINLGKMCNQVCKHCHVEAGPNRTEIMSEETVARVMEIMKSSSDIKTVDLTGGAPELNPNFRSIISESASLGKKILVRCNLTVLLEPGQEDTIEFFKANRVEVVSSLPCYSRKNVDTQRGNHVFDKSTIALQQLNRAGFGVEGTGLTLNLVYNPGGPFLPPNQESLEQQYKERLKEDLNISFNKLLTITNMPIKRFSNQLKKSGELENYYNLLSDNFNPLAAENAMCREMISISWDGTLYDCDFNQALEISLTDKIRTIWELDKLSDLQNEISIGDHCYGCTAGAGSSCGGALNQ
ncbi:MAG: radical SAM/Cys-rich domain protein [Proteobacteria bacterium]|nr:radical SAM/Cys-rich domain protein [Pseudomonadota bacterium]